ncbi:MULTISPECIES: hypothetical protein [Enterobacter cloacae complex]|uniref:hypothetical protein n=1 Tax=Enterobacter cloacae complex TaxID=354276 RepID=UPI001E284948|nr:MULTISPECIES: hypothetical protein [Enterobacter cloacae complex]MCE2008892.1 hypothetical protein [Enterobacter ludwigii]MCY0771297.1 hypothetical protein [Enterobacter cloacae complex sp. 2022EL-00788]
MNHEFTVAFNTELLVSTDNCKVLSLTCGDEQLGYIAFNTIDRDSDKRTFVTPFTAEGELKEACCASCAAKALFNNRTGFKLKLISIAETENVQPSITQLLPLLLLADIAKRAKSL